MGNKTSKKQKQIVHHSIIEETNIQNPSIHKKRLQELSCYGYIRGIEKELADKIIPDNIAAICFQYYLYVE